MGESRADDGRLKVAIVGGIWDMPELYQERMTFAPERLLADTLEVSGLDVTRIGHLSDFRPSDFDIVHVHCAAWGVVRVLKDRSDARFVYTNHASQPINARDAFLVHAAMGTADRIVALSETEKRRLARRYSVPPERSIVIANGVDASVFYFDQPEAPLSGPWRLLFVGQLLPVKNPGLLLDALGLLRDHLDFTLELVYQNSTLEQELRQKAAALGLVDRIAFAGLLRPDEVASRMRKAHVVVLSSRAEELPAVVTQALLCGRQVVTTEVGSIAEQLGTHGIIVTPEDSRALADGLERAINTYPDFCLTAAKASDDARHRFSVAAMTDAHVSAYRLALTGERAVRVEGRGRRIATVSRLAGRAYRPFANHPPARLT